MRHDPFARQRLALAAIDVDLNGTAAAPALAQASADDWDSFGEFLVWHKLAPLWGLLASRQKPAIALHRGFAALLERARFDAAAVYLEQSAAMARIDHGLGKAGVAYAAIKGAHVRERVYPDPSLRPATDIDILVAPDQRREAARALAAAGFALYREQVNLTHEATFAFGSVDVDLHWNILTPVRLRGDVVGPLLSGRRRCGGLWGLSDTDAAFLMLAHPAFTKYVTSPNAALITVVDFMLWLRRCPVDWTAVFERLEASGLKTAAWAVLSWFQMIAPAGGLAVPADFAARIRPGRLRERYLRLWLERDWASRLIDRPLAIQAGFTLPLHDGPGDAVRAVWTRVGRSAPTSDDRLGLA